MGHERLQACFEKKLQRRSSIASTPEKTKIHDRLFNAGKAWQEVASNDFRDNSTWADNYPVTYKAFKEYCSRNTEPAWPLEMEDLPETMADCVPMVTAAEYCSC